MNLFFLSWRTTVLGILTALAALFGSLVSELDGNTETVADWSQTFALVAAAIGLLFAKDSNASSTK